MTVELFLDVLEDGLDGVTVSITCQEKPNIEIQGSTETSNN